MAAKPSKNTPAADPKTRLALLKREIPRQQQRVEHLREELRLLRKEIKADRRKRNPKKRKTGFFSGLKQTLSDPLGIGGLFDVADHAFDDASEEAAEGQLDRAVKKLNRMEAEYEALCQALVPQPTTTDRTQQEKQQREQRLAAVAALKAECEQACAGISDPLIQNTVKAAYEAKIQKELERL